MGINQSGLQFAGYSLMTAMVDILSPIDQAHCGSSSGTRFVSSPLHGASRQTTGDDDEEESPDERLLTTGTCSNPSSPPWESPAPWYLSAPSSGTLRAAGWLDACLQRSVDSVAACCGLSFQSPGGEEAGQVSRQGYEVLRSEDHLCLHLPGVHSTVPRHRRARSTAIPQLREPCHSRPEALEFARRSRARNETEAAISFYLEALRHQPIHSTRSRSSRGPSSMNAVQLLTDGRATQPEDQPILQTIGELFFENGQFFMALKVFEAASFHSKSAGLMYLVGASYRKLGQLSEASAAFDAGLDIDRRHAGCLFDSAQIHQHIGNTCEASDRFQRLLDISPDHTEALLGLADVYDSNSNYTQALTCVDRALDSCGGADYDIRRRRSELVMKIERLRHSSSSREAPGQRPFEME